MKKVNEVIQYFENLYAGGAIYLWGSNGQIITKELCDRLYKSYGSKTYDRKYYDDKFLEGAGKIGADCSGSLYPMSGKDLTAQGYYNACSVKGTISYLDKSVPCLVFKGKSVTSINHVGFYCGNGYVIEMANSKDNCKKRKLDGNGWNFFGVPLWIDYSTDPVFGVDVSSIQKTIDFAAVKKAGYQFAILRTILKKGTMDTKFAENYAAVKKAGMKVGAYILSYAVSEMEAITSAQKIISALNGDKIPIFLDLESDGGQLDKIGRAGIANIAKAFMQTCQQHGHPFYIYCNQDWYKNVIDASLKPYAIWIARYGKNDGGYDVTYKPNLGEKIWQFSSRGVVPGINGNVDINACYDISIFGGATSTPTPVQITTTPINIIGIITGNGVRLRQSPNTSSTVLDKYDKGTYVQLTGKLSNGWYKTNKGYINGDYIKYLEGKVVNCNKVNVRALATKESPSLKIAYPGDQFYVMVGMGEWFNVLMKDNTVGWIKKDYVELLN